MSASTPTTQPLTRRPFAPRLSLIQSTGIVGVDLSRYWMIPVLLWLVVILIIIKPRWFPDVADLDSFLIRGYHGLCGLLCFVLGLAIAADDRERETIWFLRAQPISVKRIFASRLVSSLLLVSLFFLLSDAFVWLTKYDTLANTPWLFPTLGNYSLPSFWQFGASWPLSVAQVFALILVGLGAGSAIRNFVLAAIAGLGIYALWYTLWILTFRHLERVGNVSTFHSIMTIQQLFLSAGAAWVYYRSVSRQDAWSLIRIDHAETASVDFTSDKPLHRSMLSHLPGRHSISGRFLWASTAVLAMLILTQIILRLIITKSDSIAPIHLIATIIHSATIGSMAFRKMELSSHTSPLYWQPVTRHSLLSKRLFLTAILLIIAPVLFTPFIPLIQTYLGVMFALTAGYTALLFCFFFRNATISIILSATLLSALGAPLLAYSEMLAPSYSISNFAYLLRIGIILVCAPVLAIIIAYCKSELLSLNGGARLWVGLSAFLTYIATVGLLYTTSFTELIWLITNWTTHFFGGAK